MKTSFPRVVAALLALAFVFTACTGETGSQWTFAPVTDAGDDGAPTAASAEPTEPEAPDATVAPAEPTEPAEAQATAAPAAPEEPATPSGEPRVIELQADSALRFTDAAGQTVPDIPVSPGETVLFRIDNTAGFAHNFWIGTDESLSVPAAQTDAGIPDWSTGVQEFEWVVPDDLAGLKFACTVPGHYYTMQGTFSEASTEAPATSAPAEPAEPAATAEPEQPAASEAPAEPAEPAQASGEPRVIELEADAAIRFLQDGQQIREIDVTPGETVVFRVTNTAGFAHNFYLGADDDLRVPNGSTDTGIPDWETGVQELEWVVPEDVSDIRFACTVPGHYYTMQGDFTVTP